MKSAEAELQEARACPVLVMRVSLARQEQRVVL